VPFVRLEKLLDEQKEAEKDEGDEEEYPEEMD
jgi:hypothetical protein